MSPQAKVKRQRRRHHARKPLPVTFPELESCFANRFNAAWRKGVGDIIEAGRVLIEAKAALSGRFVGFVQTRLGWSPDMAQRLMRPAADEWFADAEHVRHLPPSWGTLYLISTLAVAERERLIEIGVIRPDMQRGDIEKEIRRLRGSGSSKRKTPTQPIIEPQAQPTKPPFEVMLTKMAANAEAEAESMAEEVEAEERCCSFCGEADVGLVANAAHSAFVCRSCAIEAAALLAPPPSPPELEALRDAMLADLVREEPPPSPSRPKRHQEVRPPARQHGDELGGGAERHNGGDGRQRATESGGNGSAP
jgi:hypothetical protein